MMSATLFKQPYHYHLGCGEARFGTPGWLITFLIVSTLALAVSAKAYNLLEGTVSPNHQWALAISELDRSEQKENRDGVALDESLFIVDLRAERLVQEVSVDFRRSKEMSLPEYGAAWSNDSTHLVATARFRRDSAWQGFAVSGHQWIRLNFQPFDPWEYMKCVLRLDESSTGESEIVKTEWNRVHELNLRVIVNLKTSEPVEMTIDCTYMLGQGAGKLTTVNSRIDYLLQ
jgi:hypothetical protein